MINGNKKLTHRCDACHTRSRKCDRLIPKCTECILYNLECGITRSIRYRKKLYFIDGSIDKFRIEPKGSKSRMPFEPFESNIDSKYDERLKNNQIAQIGKKNINNLNGALAVLNLIPSKTLLANLMTMLQFPSVEILNSGLKLLVSLATQLIKVNPKKNIQQFQKTSILIDYQIHLILEKAVECFIQNDLVLLTIINAHNFRIERFPFYTRLAIYVCGLSKLPQTELIVKLSDSFEVLLYQKFKSILKVEPNFQNLQTVIILMANMKDFKWLFGLTGRFLNFLVGTCFKLGLHLPQPGLRFSRQLKRQKVYNSVMFLMSFFLLNNGPIYYTFNKYPMRLRISYRISNEKYFMKNIDSIFPSKVDLYTSLFNEFLSDSAYALSCLSTSKAKIESQVSNFDEEFKEIFKLLKCFKESFSNFRQHLISFDSQALTREIRDLLGLYKLHSLILYHYITFFALSLRFYHGVSFKFVVSEELFKDILSLLKKQKSLGLSYLLIVVDEAIGTINSICTLKPNQLTRPFIAILSQCLLFLVRNQSLLVRDKIQESLKKGYNLLSTLNGSPHNSMLSLMNFSLLEIAKKVI